MNDLAVKRADLVRQRKRTEKEGSRIWTAQRAHARRPTPAIRHTHAIVEPGSLLDGGGRRCDLQCMPTDETLLEPRKTIHVQDWDGDIMLLADAICSNSQNSVTSLSSCTILNAIIRSIRCLSSRSMETSLQRCVTHISPRSIKSEIDRSFCHAALLPDLSFLQCPK